MKHSQVPTLARVVLLSALFFAVSARSEAQSFLANYQEPASPQLAELFRELSSSGFLEEIAHWLDTAFSLPRPITISMVECGEPTAFYISENRQVAVCYELLVQLAQEFGEVENAEGYISGALIWILLHELGHAFVHILDLPITGLEEDAVDQLATLWLLDGTEEGAFAVGSAASWFGAKFETRKVLPETLADAHSLNAQRFFNIMCWAYGSDEVQNRAVIEEGLLTLDRAATCPAEYARMKRAWELLLGPYIRDSGK